jgi:hypothetical protein
VPDARVHIGLDAASAPDRDRVYVRLVLAGDFSIGIDQMV